METFDYRADKQRWGHSVLRSKPASDRMSLEVTLFATPVPRVGDLVLLTRADGADLHGTISSVLPMMDPTDLFTVVLVPASDGGAPRQA
jgi:hypothetical protein